MYGWLCLKYDEGDTMKIRKITAAATLLAAIAPDSGHAATMGGGGFYTGLGAGFGWGGYTAKGNATISGAARAADIKLKKGKPLVLVFAGYDFCWDSFILGLELRGGYHIGKAKKPVKLGADAGLIEGTIIMKSTAHVGVDIRAGVTYQEFTV
ncbi:MAG: hypothetical protein LBD43_01375, partial [Holosporales bacterium]|nr:hypothetical protein [Holosporales bacterium]